MIAKATETAQPVNELQIKFEDDLIITVAAETLNDMRFLELYEQISDNQLKLPKLLRFMFGDEVFDSIYTYYETKGQKFTITKMGDVFTQLETDLSANPDFLK